MAISKITRQTEVPGDYSAGWLNKLDGRYALAREMRGRFDEIATDAGGIDNLSYAKRSLIERSVWAEFWINQQEQQIAKGGDVDIGKLVQATNSLLGLFRTIGLERRAKDVPDLHEYLANRQHEASA